MLTQFGKALQKHRIDKGVKLKDLADVLSKSASFISAIAHGKKDTSQELVGMIGDYLQLTKSEKEQLHRLSLVSQNSVRLDIVDLGESSKGMVAAFARKLTNLTPEQESSIISILDGADTW